jgi:hypothetical protein
MITLTFTAENTAALIKDVQAMFNSEETVAEQVNAKPPRAPKKTSGEVAQSSTVVTPASTPTAAASPVTLDDVKQIIPKVLTHAGKDKLVALLAQYGAKKGSEIKESQYAEFLTNCNILLA